MPWVGLQFVIVAFPDHTLILNLVYACSGNFLPMNVLWSMIVTVSGQNYLFLTSL